MSLQKCTLIISSLIVLIVSFSGRGFSQTAPDSAGAGRASALRELLGSIEGTPREAPRIFKTPEGYLRFVGAPPSTRFPVDPNKRTTHQQAADAFLGEYRNLFVNESPVVAFETFRVDNRDSRTYVRYQQMYGDLKVFGAEMVMQVNATGGIDAVMSDIMRDTQALDTDVVSLNPTIDASIAEGKAIEWLAAQHEQLEFEASDVTLMVFDPPVVGWKGPTKLVWHINVTNVGELRVQEFVLVDAHDGTIAFYYSRICYALNREIQDYETSEWYYEWSDWPTEIEDVNLAYEYLEDTWWFFKNHHDRDGYDGSGNEPEKAIVNYTDPERTAWWGEYMTIEPEVVVDDVVAHEFAHGVSNTNPCNLWYTFNEAGAICEMFSDIWGEFVDQENLVSKTGNDLPEDKWLLFEDQGGDVPGSWRNMKDPPLSEHGPAPAILYGEHWYPLCTEGDCPDCPDSPQGHPWPGRYCFTHRNCGVGNKLCYLLTDGDTFNGHTVSEMGMETVSNLFYESQYILTSQCDYYDLYNALTQAAIELGLSQAERDNIEKGCLAVEISPTKELVGWWKFDEGEGTIAEDSVFDNDGEVVGATWTSGKIGGALDFGGDDYVELDYSINALKSSLVTISAWIKGDSIGPSSGYHPIVSTYDYKGYVFPYHYKYGYVLYVKDKMPRFYLASGSAHYYVGSSELEIDNGWHHLAGTYDGDTLKIYVDGESVHYTPPIGLTGYYDDYDKTYIGYEDRFYGDDVLGYPDSDIYFDGIIDDVRVYRRPLEIFEIWDAMSGDLPRFRIKNSSDETVAWFDSFGNLFLKGKQKTWQEWQPPGQADEFIIEKNNGAVVYISDSGDLFLKIGRVTEGPEATGADEFRVQNSSGVDVAIIKAADGSVYLKGKLYQQNP